ncbi:MAG: Fic family protein [Verrucomicrobia bacterium]|nr:Fic family protein [Verrucomicrobiota bacterium]
MNIAEYRSGIWKDQYQYKSFSPSLVNLQWRWDLPELDTLLAEANRKLGELNGLSIVVPDLDRFIQMHVVKEAQSSSRIEGTETGMAEALREDPEDIAPEKRDDWQEVRNYIDAMKQSLDELKSLPLCNRLLCDTHGILLQGARGEKKSPGEFRRSQNWIGGASIQDAVFIPPHHEDLPVLLGDLEDFWHNESIHVPHLIRIAISHYQFETIHPFLDGNGRIGRLLITLYLVDKELLDYPCLYLSSHLEKHRSHYYDALTHVRNTHDLAHWIRFFLVGIIETSKNSINTFRSIFELRNRTTALLETFGRATPNATRFVNYLYSNPIITSVEIAGKLELSQTTVDRLIALLMKNKVLGELTGQRRNRVFFFKEYYQIFVK